MLRRKFTVCCGLTAIVAGCLDASSEDSEEESANNDSEGNVNESDSDDFQEDMNESDSNDNDSSESSQYVISVQAPEASIGDEEFCKFDDLPKIAQYEFEHTIQDADFETEDRVHYEMEQSPQLLETDCYTKYIRYKNKYYQVAVMTNGG